MLKMKFSRLFQLISKMNSSLDTQSRFDQFLNVVVMISISTITTQVEIDAENTKYMYGLRSKELSFEFLLFGDTISQSFPCQATSSFSPLTAHEKKQFRKALSLPTRTGSNYVLHKELLQPPNYSTKKCVLFFPCIHYSNFS